MPSRRSTLSTQMTSVCHGLPVQPVNPPAADHVNYTLSSGTDIHFGYIESAKAKVSCDHGPGKKRCSLKSKKAWHNSCGPMFLLFIQFGIFVILCCPYLLIHLLIHLNYRDCFAFVCNICGVFPLHCYA